MFIISKVNVASYHIIFIFVILPSPTFYYPHIILCCQKGEITLNSTQKYRDIQNKWDKCQNITDI